eukprot:766389-Hanusia_phi.AAC.4
MLSKHALIRLQGRYFNLNSQTNLDIVDIFPRNCPVKENLTFTVRFSDALSFSRFKPLCWLSQCYTQPCLLRGQCKCSLATAGVDSVLLSSNVDLPLNCFPSVQRATSPASLNGHHWTTAHNHFLTFFDAPVLMDNMFEAPVQQFSTQIGTTNGRLVVENKSATINTYLQLAPCNVSDPSGIINCYFYNQTVSTSGSIEYRLSPGVCDPFNSDLCCSTGHDIPLTFVETRGFCEGFTKLTGSFDSVSAGYYHTCMSYHSSQFFPLRILYFQGGTGPSGCIPSAALLVPATPVEVLYFTVYNVNLQKMQPNQIPANYEVQVTIFGTDFSTLISPDRSFQSVDFQVMIYNTDLNFVSVSSTDNGITNSKVSADSVSFSISSTFFSNFNVIYQETLNAKVSFDGSFWFPANGIPFILYQVSPTMTFFPLYGLFDTEVNVTITGNSFDPSRPAKCRFPNMPCMNISGQNAAPCERDATIISVSKCQCTLPARGAAQTSEVTIQFSPDTTISAVSEMMFTKYASKFTFHKSFSTAYLDSNSAPVDSSQYGSEVRDLYIDATSEKIQIIPENVCLDLVKIHSLNMLVVSVVVMNANVHIPRIPVSIHSVVGAVGTCAEFHGFCARPDCEPTIDLPGGPNDCCLAEGMIPDTCCPLNHTGDWAAKSLCFAPNIISDPMATEVRNSCPATIRFALPRMRFCRGGPMDSSFCTSDSDCLSAGECAEMPVNTIVQLSTDGGQHYSGPSSASILFYRPVVITSWSPFRILKDCGANCGVRNGLVTDSGKTLCGLEPSCTKRSPVVVILGPDLIAGTCNGCDVVTIMDDSFALAKCKFQSMLCVEDVCNPVPNGTVIVPGEFSLGGASYQISCPSPVLRYPSLVHLSIALDSKSFVGNSGSQHVYILFISPPSVLAVFPANGIYDAETSITVIGKDFCNKTASISCDSRNSTFAWCIFDYKNIAPPEEQWNVPNKYTPATIVNETMAVCQAPAIIPDIVPARPRAKVGLILNGFVNSFGVLVNAGDVTILRINPEAGTIGSPTRVQIDGYNLFDKYRGCPGQVEQLYLPLGVLASQGCNSSESLSAKLYCKFGNQTVLAQYAPSEVIDSFVCLAPAFTTTDGPVSVSVSLNGEKSEYSNTLSFTFANPVIEALFPSMGFGGGSPVTIRGKGFVDVPQLSCLFYPTLSSKIVDGTVTTDSLVRKATFLSPSEVQCVMPAAWEYPLSCACNCFKSICTPPLMRYNVSAYSFLSLSQKHATETTTWADVTLGIERCAPNEIVTCAVHVHLVLNLYDLPVNSLTYQYNMSRPVLTSIRPSAGPLSGGTVITLNGGRFSQSSAWCVFGFNSYSPITFIDSSIVTCTAPKACEWRASQRNSLLTTGNACVFPFRWNGTWQTSCVNTSQTNPFFGTSPVPNDKFCAITTNFLLDKQWGDCFCKSQSAGRVRSNEWLYYEDFTLQRIFPRSGKDSGNAVITLSVSRLNGMTLQLKCQFIDSLLNSSMVSATIVDDTTLVCLSPARGRLLSSVSVRLTDNEQLYTNALPYYFFTAPRLTKAS